MLLLFLAGAATAEMDGSLAPVIFVAIAGTFLGDTVSYGLGRWGSGWIAGTRLGASLKAGEALVAGRARWLIPFYHLQSVTRAVGPFASGALRLPLRIWLPLDYAGALLSNVVWVGAGALFGRALLTDRGTLEPDPAVRVGLAVAAVAWVLIARRTLLARQRESHAGVDEVATAGEATAAEESAAAEEATAVE